jgi:hypothetical protein
MFRRRCPPVAPDRNDRGKIGAQLRLGGQQSFVLQPVQARRVRLFLVSGRPALHGREVVKHEGSAVTVRFARSRGGDPGHVKPLVDTRAGAPILRKERWAGFSAKFPALRVANFAKNPEGVTRM